MILCNLSEIETVNKVVWEPSHANPTSMGEVGGKKKKWLHQSDAHHSRWLRWLGEFRRLGTISLGNSLVLGGVLLRSLPTPSLRLSRGQTECYYRQMLWTVTSSEPTLGVPISVEDWGLIFKVAGQSLEDVTAESIPSMLFLGPTDPRAWAATYHRIFGPGPEWPHLPRGHVHQQHMAVLVKIILAYCSLPARSELNMFKGVSRWLSI